ncbi:MAG TPA: MarR family transcriptional regulator [Vicinamibacterales bacterium]|nr:MarR family transcriptional regulator [Vicinamibacterales bacterium]
MPRGRRTDYRTLAEFRYQIRRYLAFSERAVRAYGLDVKQHQLLLALKGLPAGVSPTIGALARRLLVRHHSAVGLIDRLAEKGLVTRRVDPADRRRVLVKITRKGEAVLRRLTRLHRDEIATAGPALLRALRALIS